MWKDQTLAPRVFPIFKLSARVQLCMLIVATLTTIFSGTFYTFYDFRLIFQKDFNSAIRIILIVMLSVLAIVEILRTALVYFTEGRVKVTYIIDAVLVTILTEILAFRHKEMSWQKLAMTIGLIISLALARIVAVRFSPRTGGEEL
jgi:uncharacterized membrane protein (DUF373 family)